MTTILGYLQKPIPDLITDVTYKAVDYLRSKPKAEEAKVQEAKVEEPRGEEEVKVTPPEASVVQKESVEEKVVIAKASDELSIHLGTPSALVREQEITKAFKKEAAVSVVKKDDTSKSTASKRKVPHNHSHHHKSHKSHSHKSSNKK